MISRRRRRRRYSSSVDSLSWTRPRSVDGERGARGGAPAGGACGGGGTDERDRGRFVFRGGLGHGPHGGERVRRIALHGGRRPGRRHLPHGVCHQPANQRYHTREQRGEQGDVKTVPGDEDGACGAPRAGDHLLGESGELNRHRVRKGDGERRVLRAPLPLSAQEDP
eukprot:5992481-Pyramimonas_sp.AAC.1